MSDKHKDCNHPRLYVRITPGGVQIDLVGAFTVLGDLMDQGKYREVSEYIDTFGLLFTASALKRYEYIEDSYQTAIVKNFADQLDNDAALAALLEEDQ